MANDTSAWLRSIGDSLDPYRSTQVFRQAFHFDGVHGNLEDAAVVFDPGGFANGLDRDLGVQLLVSTHGVEVDVQNVPAQRVMLRGLTSQEAKELVRLLRKALAAANELSRAPLLHATIDRATRERGM